MKILVINASPKLKNSNTLKLTNAFLEGFSSVIKSDIYIVDIYKSDIKPCRGCFYCWNKTPGKCVINDDMKALIEKMIYSDIIIFSFPLYYFGIPSQLKAFMDRQLPMSLPFMADEEGGGHPSRYNMENKRYVMISTCGFYTAEGNYDVINARFDRIYGSENYTTIYCGQGELFKVKELKNRTDRYLNLVKKAGCEHASGGIHKDTVEGLKELLYPRNVFEQMADASWGIEKNLDKEEKTDPSLVFTRQMAALYNKNSWSGRDVVLEFVYTDVKKKYQIVLGKNGQKVLTKDFMEYTTRIETPLSVWRKIGSGDIDGRDALMNHLYRVSGDFNIMINWDKYFGISDSIENNKREYESDKEKKTNMSLMLLPWILLWILIPINNFYGALIVMGLCSVITLLFIKFRPTVFDYISGLVVTFISILSVLSCPMDIIIPVSYLIFGVMWSVTVFMKIPLSAYYSMNNYGEIEALKNPLFVRTNRILTACWGGLYLITPVWTYFLLQSSLSVYTGAINSVRPAVLGIFTVWFEKWYPKHYANKGCLKD